MQMSDSGVLGPVTRLLKSNKRKKFTLIQNNHHHRHHVRALVQLVLECSPEKPPMAGYRWHQDCDDLVRVVIGVVALPDTDRVLPQRRVLLRCGLRLQNVASSYHRAAPWSPLPWRDVGRAPEGQLGGAFGDETQGTDLARCV